MGGKLHTVEYQIGIIGGTGITVDILGTHECTETIQTSFGSAVVTFGTLSDRPAVFLHRHGEGHKDPPHAIKHRANIAAMASLGIQAIFATSAVGSLHLDIKPGTIVLLSDLIDLTRNQAERTFFHNTVVHTDVVPPYSEPLRHAIYTSARSLNTPIRHTATYVCTDGPRFETPAEIRMMAGFGGDVVGMTVASEAMLCIEAGIHYCGISIVTNLGAGLSQEPIIHGDVHSIVLRTAPRLREIIELAISDIDVKSLTPRGTGAFDLRFSSAEKG